MKYKAGKFIKPAGLYELQTDSGFRKFLFGSFGRLRISGRFDAVEGVYDFQP